MNLGFFKMKMTITQGNVQKRISLNLDSIAFGLSYQKFAKKKVKRKKKKIL